MSPAPLRTRAYVSCAESREILVLALDNTSGELSLVQRVNAGGMVMPLAITPDRGHLFAALRSPPYRVAAFAIDPTHGTLAPLGATPVPDSLAYLATDRTGSHLLGASYGGHKAVVCRIGESGLAAAAHEIIDTEPNAHAIVPDPTNRFVFVPCLGAHAVMQYRFDETGGTLEPNRPARIDLRKGSGPRHFVFHPGGAFAYLLNELDASVAAFSVDADAGTLSLLQTWPTLPPGFPEQPWAADLHLTPDGRHLYTTERRSSTLAIFAVGNDGLLSPRGHCPTEREPRGFGIAPSGRHLLSVGQASHSMTAYAIDPSSGALAELRKYAMGKGPNWVEIIDLP